MKIMQRNPNHTKTRRQVNGLKMVQHTHGVKHDVGKPNNGETTGFNVVARKTAQEYHSKAAGQRVAGAIFQNMKQAGKL